MIPSNSLHRVTEMQHLDVMKTDEDKGEPSDFKSSTEGERKGVGDKDGVDGGPSEARRG